MSIPKKEAEAERRIREIYELTRHEGWKHIEAMFRDQLADLKSIDLVAALPKEEVLDAIKLQIQVAGRLEGILNRVSAEASHHAMSSVDEVRVYGEEDFGLDSLDNQ
jgi:hypothetical protein